MKIPLITVVTVVWNDESHIAKTIESVISQTYDNFEYIVIDGESNDATWDVISKYKNYLTFAVSEPDNGIYDAMNKSIDLARGEWIIFMNSGDYFYDKSTIERVFSNYVDNGESIVYGDAFVMNHPNYGNYHAKAYMPTNSDKVYQPSFHQAIFTRTKELKQYHFDQRYSIIADFVFYYDLYGRNNKWYYANTLICFYDYTGISSTSRKRIMYEKALLYFRKRIIFKALFYYLVYLKRCISG